MKIGDLDVGSRLLLAPMADVTDSSFRKISRSFGAGLVFTQMVSAEGIINNSFATYRLLVFERAEQPIGVQILGNDEYILSEAVKELSNFKPNVIDLNCGCPIDKVVKKKMGAALLEDPSHLHNLVKSMVKASGGIPISVKIRLGKDRKNINAVEISKAIEDAGASYVTLHTRAKTDKYNVDADWEWLVKVKQAVKIPVVGNGSVFSAEDALEMITTTGVDGVMIARGALGNPFIFSSFNSLVESGNYTKPTIQLVTDTLLNHIAFLQRDYPENEALNYSKKHSIWYLRYFNGIEKFIKVSLVCRNIDCLVNEILKHKNEIENGLFKSNNLGIYEERFRNKVVFWLSDFEKIENE